MSGSHGHGGHHNEPHHCGAANAQNQTEMIWWLQQIKAGQDNAAATQSESILRAKLPFSYGDVAERLVYRPRSGELITRVVIVLLEAFNDGDALVSVGDFDNRDRLFATGSIDVLTAATFAAYPNYEYPTDGSIHLFLEAKLSTFGRGLLYIYSD